MIAYLLAGGHGRKFWPFAETRNKCAFPIANKPAIRRLADQLALAGVTRLVVVTGPWAGSIRAALEGCPADVRFVDAPEASGPAAALVSALNIGRPETVLAVYADTVTTQASIRSVVEAATAAGVAGVAGAAAGALVVPLDGDRPGDWISCRERAGVVTEIEGHGRDGSHRLGGLFYFTPSALPTLLAHPGLMTHVPVGGMPAPGAELGQTLGQLSARGLSVEAIAVAGFAYDLDKPWHILRATRAVTDEFFAELTTDVIAPGARVHDGAEVEGRVWLGEGAEIGNRVVVRGGVSLGSGARLLNGAILGQACTVGERACVRDYALLGDHTVIGAESLCGHGAEMEGVLLEGAYLYHYCEMYGVVGAKVDIGAATVCGTLRFDDGETVHTIAGRREQPALGANCAYLGDFSRTGVNAVLMPGVKVGAWSCVGAGVVLYEDLPSRQMVLVRQELSHRAWGPERYGW